MMLEAQKPTTEQQRANWLEWRRSRICASDVASIIGDPDAFDSPWSIWARKVGLLPEKESTAVMTAGHYAELYLAPWFEAETGLRVLDTQVQVELEGTNHAATLDGLVDENHDREPESILEIKSAAAYKQWSEIPTHYKCQGQWQMHVTGYQKVYFGVFSWPFFNVFELERNQADIDYLVDRTNDWWNKYVVTGIEPPVDSHQATLDAVRKVHGTSTPGVEKNLDNFAEYVFMLREGREMEKEAKAKVAKASAGLISAMGDAEVGIFAGEQILTCKQQISERLDTERVRAEHPEIAKECTKTTTTRVLRQTTRKRAS